jgi:hypothetical protein
MTTILSCMRFMRISYVSIMSWVAGRRWRRRGVWNRARNGTDCVPGRPARWLQAVREADFRQGAALPHPAGLFNAGLGGGTRRVIDIREGDKVDAAAFKALVRAAVALNKSGKGSVKA